MTRAVRGELEVRVKGLSDGARLVDAAMRQAVYAICALTAFVTSLVLHVHGEPVLARYAVYGASAFAALFVGSALLTSTGKR